MSPLRDPDTRDAVELVKAAPDPRSPVTVDDAVPAVEALATELEALRSEKQATAEAQTWARAMPVRYGDHPPDPAGLATGTKTEALTGLGPVMEAVRAVVQPRHPRTGEPYDTPFGPGKAISDLTGADPQGLGPCNKVAWINANNPYFEAKFIQEFDPTGVFWRVQVRDRDTGEVVAEEVGELRGDPSLGHRGYVLCEKSIDAICGVLAVWTLSLIGQT